jgi:hypothetical protein
MSVSGDFLQRLPERIFETDACFVASNDDGPLDDKRLHDNSPDFLLQIRDIETVNSRHTVAVVKKVSSVAKITQAGQSDAVIREKQYPLSLKRESYFVFEPVIGPQTRRGSLSP